MRLLSNKPLTEGDQLEALNREIVPAVRSLQLFARDAEGVATDAAAAAAAAQASANSAAASAVIAQAAADAAQAAADGHASRHIKGGADQIDGDLIDVDFSPANSTSTPGPNGTSSVDQLTSILNGLDIELRKAKTETWYGRGTHVLATNVVYLFPIGRNEGEVSGTIADQQLRLRHAVEFSNFGFQLLTSSGDADTFNIALNVNGTDRLTSATIACTNLTVQNVSGTYSASEGDLVTIARNEVSGDVSINDLIWWVDVRRTD